MNKRRTGDKGGSKQPASRKLRDAKRPGTAAQQSRPGSSPTKQTGKAVQQPRAAKSSSRSGNSARSAKGSGHTDPKSSLNRSAPKRAHKGTKQSVPSVAARRAGKSAAQDTGPATSARSQATSLAADCTIAQAGDIKSRLARVLTKQAPVVVDLSEVRRIDTAGLQVLAAFIRERRAAGREVHCEGATESFQVTAALLGLGALFSPVMDERLSGPAAGNA